MNDRQKIKAEIEKRMKDCEKAFQICPSTAFGSKIDSYKELLSFIDSIPEDDGSNDLDEEIVNWCNHGDFGFDYMDIRDTVHHFANWQKQQLMNEIWHKGTDNPGNKHPYPVINPDTQEMAFAYYDQRFGLWEFDRDYDPGSNMLWLDIEKIIPNLPKGGKQ